MAKVKTNRVNGSLIVRVVPSLDHPEEVAVCMAETETLRIHAPNGGYLFSLAVEDGQIIRFSDAGFRDGTFGERHDKRSIT